ncbi:hypothetical protein MMC20_004007 [Loxospora ochrophaea]|nr:hypothetical protein [Loxospora ochrophaea]
MASIKHPAALLVPGGNGEINPQYGCPFFNRIPGELRNQIFHLALTAYDDKSQPFDQHSYYYRPGFHYRKRIDTSLLRTCRLVHLETQLMPIQINDFIDWFGRGPPRGRSGSETAFDKMTYEQRKAVRHIHYFTQQYALEGFGRRHEAIHPDVEPRTLKLTLRHSDWWWWERNSPLRLDAKRAGIPSPGQFKEVSEAFEDASWGTVIENLKSLKKFVLELETVQDNKGQLENIVAHAAGWQFKLGDSNVLDLDHAQTERSSWTGSKYYGGHRGMLAISSYDRLIHGLYGRQNPKAGNDWSFGLSCNAQ